MSKPHGSRLEYVGNLRVHCRVVPAPAEVEGVATRFLVRETTAVAHIPAAQEDG